MRKSTDKYHKLANEADKFSPTMLDIKEVPKRNYQLGLGALFTGIFLSIGHSYLGLYVSSFLIACFCFLILLVILLKFNNAINQLTFSIISMVCGLLIIEAFLEGLASEQYLYFFPLLVVIPLIVDLKKTQYKESFTYIGIVVISFITCILIGYLKIPGEDSTLAQINKLAYINRIVSIISTIIFAGCYILFEKKYIDELVLQNNKALESRTRFLATMGHELRTPLNGIIGTINLLKQHSPDLQQDEYFQILKYCSDHMLQQVNNILDFNKIEADKLEIHPVPLNLEKLLLNIGMPFVSLFQQKGLELKIEIEEGLNTIVLADDLRMIQIFNNLLSNALKFTESGFIKVKVNCIFKDEESLNVSFVIEDTGIGIHADDQEKIFNSFEQVYNEKNRNIVGTGLGLTICVRLLKLMNSKLMLTSEMGIGSKFHFEVKFKRIGLQQLKLKIDDELDDNLSGVKLLLVEDNEINMMIARKILVGYQANVTCKFNGKEAIDELIANADYDVILMDLEMPVMNGYDAIYEIRELLPQIPVIAFTASLVDRKMLSDLLSSGFNDCMLKPFQPYQLLSIIKKNISPNQQLINTI